MIWLLSGLFCFLTDIVVGLEVGLLSRVLLREGGAVGKDTFDVVQAGEGFSAMFCVGLVSSADKVVALPLR